MEARCKINSISASCPVIKLFIYAIIHYVFDSRPCTRQEENRYREMIIVPDTSMPADTQTPALVHDILPPTTAITDYAKGFKNG